MEDADRIKDIENWIRTKIAKKNKAIGLPICPFAKKTLQDKKFQISKAKQELASHVRHCCSLFPVLALDIIILYIPYKITEKQLQKICRNTQSRYPLLAVLYDHPANAGLIKGQQFSYQKCPLVMIQDMKQLKSAQKLLREKTNYYDIVQNDDMFV